MTAYGHFLAGHCCISSFSSVAGNSPPSQCLTSSVYCCLCFRYPSAMQYSQYKWLSRSLAVHLMAIFPGRPELAGTRTSPFWRLLELRMMEVVVTTGATRHEKLQSNRHHQQTNIQYFTGRMHFVSPNQQCQSSEGWSVQMTADSYLSRLHCVV